MGTFMDSCGVLKINGFFVGHIEEFGIMPQFKVGDSVRVIGQRVYPSNGNVPIGATGKIHEIAGTEYLVKFDPKIPSGEEYAGFFAGSLELCQNKRFKVGDAVRVKAGSPVWGTATCNSGEPIKQSFGKKLTVVVSRSMFGNEWVDDEDGKTDSIHAQYLEPWNAAEEWNGTAWVAKKKSEPKPAVVARRGCSAGALWASTSEGVKHAKKLASEEPGVEFVVYQEKASFKVDRPSRVGKRYVLVKPCMFASGWNQRIGDVAKVVKDCGMVILSCPRWRVNPHTSLRPDEYCLDSEALAKEFVEIND
jgi:uncharacterized protein YodC (DUF2158 family)